MSFEEFSVRYRSMFGIEVTRDTELSGRSEPGTASAVALFDQTDMITRDENLLAMIDKELALKKARAGGVWRKPLDDAFESAAERLGKPKIATFFE